MSLKKKTIHGLAWSFASQGGKLFSQFIITAILARLLSPNDFGLVGMATVFTGFATLFAELGISGALIQKQDINESHLSSAFWLNVMVGILATILFVVAAPLIARFYNKPELAMILVVLSVNFFLASFTIIPQTILTKEMNFRSLTIRDIVAVIIAGLAGMFFAYRGWGVWSLVFQSIAFTLSNAMLLWGVSKWRPRFMFSIDSIKDIFKYSAHLTGFNIVNYIARNIDYLLIGKFLGAESLGFYTLAYRLMLVPLQNISGVISKVIFPAFSRIQNDLGKIRKSYLKMAKAIALVTFPLMGCFFVVAPEFVRIVYGPKWDEAILLIQIMCCCGAVQSVSTIVGNIRLSQGQTRLHLTIGIYNAVLAALAIVVGLNWGIQGVCISYTIFSFFWFYFTNALTLPLIHLKVIQLVQRFKMPIIIMFMLLVSLLFLKRLILNQNIYSLSLFIGIAISIYILLLIATKQVAIKNNQVRVDLEN